MDKAIIYLKEELFVIEDMNTYDRIRYIMVEKDARHTTLSDDDKIFFTNHWRDFPRSFIRRNIKEILWDIMFTSEFPYFTSQDVSEISDVIFQINYSSFRKEDWGEDLTEEEAKEKFENYMIDIIYHAIKLIPDIPIYYVREMIIKYITNPKFEKITEAIQIYCQIPENLIEEFYNFMNLKIISSTQKLSPGFIKRHREDLYWTGITAKQDMSITFIIENFDFLDKPILFQRYDIFPEESLDFMVRKLIKKIPARSRARADIFKWISERKYISIKFLKKYYDKMSWDRISRCICLTEPFIREFYDDLDPFELKRNVTYNKELEKLYHELKNS